MISDTANNSKEHCGAALRIDGLYQLELNVFLTAMLRKDTAYIRGYATGHNAQAASAVANVAKHMQAELTAHMLRLLRRQLIRREVAKMLLKAVEKKSTEVNM